METVLWAGEKPYEPASYAMFLLPLYFPFAPPDIRDDLLKDWEIWDRTQPSGSVGFKPYNWKWYRVGDKPKLVSTFQSDYTSSPQYESDMREFLKLREQKLIELFEYLGTKKGKGKHKSSQGYEEFVKHMTGKTLKEFRGGKVTHRLSFLKKHKISKGESLSLEEISELSGYPIETLQEVYNRGIGAYKTNPESVRVKGSFKKDPKAPLSKKLSKEQWGYARVFSFVDGNKKHDQDLR